MTEEAGLTLAGVKQDMFDMSCTVPSLLQTHRTMAVRSSTKPSWHLLYTSSTSYYMIHLYGQITTPVFLQKDSFSHRTCVKLLSYSFSSNTVQPSRLFYLLQSTKDPLLLFFPKRHYRHLGYTINTQKYTNQNKRHFQTKAKGLTSGR